MGTGIVVGGEGDSSGGPAEEGIDSGASFINGLGSKGWPELARPRLQTLLRFGVQRGFADAEFPQQSLQVVPFRRVDQGGGQLGSHLVFVTVGHPLSVMVERH